MTLIEKPIVLRTETIPEEIKKRTQWVTWWAKPKANGKFEKVPVDPKTGRYASVSDPSTWGTFEQAVDYSNNHADIKGIGFVFTEDDPFTGIDLDDCRNPESGEIDHWAKQIIEEMDSYTEVSPSLTGVKILVEACLPGRGRKKAKIETYNDKRFFALTGRHIEGAPRTIEHRGEEVKRFSHEYLGSSPENEIRSSYQECASSGLSDAEVLERLQQGISSEKFNKLFYEGDTSDYSSPSEADAALCAMIAIRTGSDPEQVERIFSQSALAKREKWKRKDYRKLTIDFALNLTRENNGKTGGDLKVTNGNDPTKLIDTRFPIEIMSGVAGEVAELYSSYLESPKQFFYMAFLTCLGCTLSGRLTISAETEPQPRMYTILLGESAATRKSTAINKTIEFFDQSVCFRGFNDSVCRGVGSAEGLSRVLKERKRVLLCFDELKQFVSKSRIDTSVLLPCVNTLFELNQYENVTANKKLKVTGSHLSLLAASTLATYETIFDSASLNIGFNNRLWLVPGGADPKFSIPYKVPVDAKRKIWAKMERLKNLSIENPILEMQQDARKKYDDFYKNRERSIYTSRLGTYALRLMPLLAINDFKGEIDEETVEKVITLCNWQLSVRKVYDPIDSETKMAEVEEAIRRQLKNRGALSKRDVRRYTNVDRKGLSYFGRALINLTENGDIELIGKGKGKKYWFIGQE